MFSIKRDVYVAGQKVGTMEVVYDGDVKITHTSQETGEVAHLNLSFETADTLYDLMTLARPTRGDGHPY